MTDREQQVLAVIESAGGTASAVAIGCETGISPDYAEQICRDLVWRGKLYRKGRHFVFRT